MLQGDLAASLRESKEALQREVDIMAQLEAQDQVPPSHLHCLTSTCSPPTAYSTNLCQSNSCLQAIGCIIWCLRWASVILLANKHKFCLTCVC